jgi:hypothetical protein
LHIADVPRETLQDDVTPIPGLPPHLHVQQRCNRWGTWVIWQRRSGVVASGPQRVRSWWGMLILVRNVPQGWTDPRERCPVDQEEVRETAEAIRRLPEALRDVITAEHACTGTQEAKAMVLGISKRTYHRRVAEGYALLLGLMQDIAAGL